MEKMNKKEDGLKDVELVWIFDAPVETVWKAFTDPEMEKQWSRCFTPVGSTEMEFLVHDLRVGGKFLHRSVVPWGKVQYITGTYKKIIPLEELAYTESFADEKGNVISGRQMGMDYYIPLEWMVDITFETFQNGTRIKLIQSNQPTNGHSDIAATEIAKSLFILSSIIEGSTI
jgi:uncharacterized protein YndB with AHSA1/START domain